MKVNLIVTKGSHEGTDIPVTKHTFLIGRHKGSHVRLSSDKVSAHHCAILLKDDGAWVRDFDSTNGTYVNDEKVAGDKELHDGDVLKVGPFVAKVKVRAGERKVKRPGDEEAAAEMLNDSSSGVVEGMLGLSGSDFGDTVLKLPELPDKKT
jgi:pSer/pThr/pTyr-binding forkhead associated (FHA) protein